MTLSQGSKLVRHDSAHGPDLRIFVKDVKDRNGRKRPLTVRSWSTVKDVKDALQQHLHVPPSSQRLYFGPLMTSGRELPNHRTLHDAGIYRSGETLLLDIQSAGGAANEATSLSSLRSTATSDICISSSLVDAAPKGLRRIVQQARRGLAVGLKPDLVLDGSGGTYFLHDARKVRVAVFKPADEEPYAENNPRGYVPQGGGDSLREGVKPGELCIREVAAFLLDHGGFSGVPMTTLAEARHPAFNTNGARWKLSEGGAAVGSHSLSISAGTSTNELAKKVGSVQEYINAECSMDDLSPSKLSVDEVHKIAILDIRLMNADRNSANLLCRRKPEDPDNFELLPIDHGYCLRSVCDVAWFDWCWLDWPQMKQPLSRKNREYILKLDVEADARLLKERLHISTEALDYFRASCSLLQAGVRAGLSLYEIAVMCCRNDDAGEVPSKLETLVSMAAELARSAVDNGRWHHAAASQALVEQLTPDGDIRPNNLPASVPPKFVSSKIFKSASSANFSFRNTSFLSEESFSMEPFPETSNPPQMAQSSGSDSSSDAGGSAVEREECEEWAAALVAVADESLDKDTPSHLRRRSLSVCSSSSSGDSSAKLSSSPVGFWYIRPGSAVSDDGSDDEGVAWSPFVTPRASICASISSLERAPPAPPLSKVGQAADDDAENEERFGLAFREYPEAPLIPPPTSSIGDVPPLKLPLAEITTKAPALCPRPASPGVGLVRSLSYSAFSFKSEKSSSSSVVVQKNSGAGSSTSLENDQYRTYLLKFVDLLIVRETMTASRKKKMVSSVPSTSPHDLAGSPLREGTSKPIAIAAS